PDTGLDLAVGVGARRCRSDHGRRAGLSGQKPGGGCRVRCWTMTLMNTWRPLSSADVPAWATLTNLLAVADGTEEFYEEDDLAEELTEHGFNPELDSWAGWDGRLRIGSGQRSVREDHGGNALAHMAGGSHPDDRGRGRGRELMGLMETRAVAACAERYPGARQLWRVPGNLEGAAVRRMLEHRG